MVTLERTLTAALATLACLTTANGVARADDAACIQDASEGQRLRDEGKLRAARERLVACARSACPQIVSADCGRWLTAVEERIPSIVLSARDNTGRDVGAVRVLLDAAPFVGTLDGRAVPLDPGAHVLRFEGAGFEPLEVRIIANESEKGRAVGAVLVRTAPPKLKEAPSKSPTPSPPERPVPLATWILGGVAVAGFAGFGALWFTGTSDGHDLRTCAPRCSQDQIDDVELQLRAAQISLGIGAAAAIAAGILYATRPTRTSNARTGSSASRTLEWTF